MSNRNLFLVSLFVVLGIAATATSALAQTTWTVPAPLPLTYGRSEGKAEATAPITISLTTPGTVSANTYFTITYSAPISAIGTVDVTCGGPAGSRWASGCIGLYYPTVSGNAVTEQFSAAMTFHPGDRSYLTVIVRVDASRAWPIPGQVTAAVTATTSFSMDPISVSPTSAQQVLLVNAKPSLSLQYDHYKDTLVGAPDTGTPSQALTCSGPPITSPVQFIVNLAENFPEALTTEAQEAAWDPGSRLHGESGSQVTNGSNIIVTFSNVPAQVVIAAGNIEPCSTLNTADPLYCPGGSLGLTFVSSSPGALPTQASFTYTVSSLDAEFAENVDLDFLFWTTSALPQGLPPMTVNVAFAPTTAPADAPPVPYFTGRAEAVTPLPVVNFSDCVTYLLFPFVINYGPWDTDITVANTTMDPFGSNPATAKGSAVPQSGKCTVYFYPSAGGGPPTVFSSPTIAAGGMWATDLGATGEIPAGTEGYAIAVCNFQNACGYAAVNYNFGLSSAIFSSYLAYILPNPALYHRTPAGQALGEDAIAPVNTMELLQKLVHDSSKK